jgi:hypothetical protein
VKQRTFPNQLKSSTRTFLLAVVVSLTGCAGPPKLSPDATVSTEPATDERTTTQPTTVVDSAKNAQTPEIVSAVPAEAAALPDTPSQSMDPPSPAASQQIKRWYDMDEDGTVDFCEMMDPDGPITVIGYDHNGDKILDETINLVDIPASERRDLILILDSVPFPLAEEAWQAGKLRYTHRPSLIIAPFPVMTDPCLTEFFQMSPGIAVESAYYDGEQLTDAYKLYSRGGVAIWHQHVDYFLRHAGHGLAYVWSYRWFDHELSRVQNLFMNSDQERVIGYFVGTSSLGASHGRKGHLDGIDRIDRYCRQIVHDTRGRARITLMSDHGHNLVGSERISLVAELKERGLNPTTRLQAPNDVVAPEFAMCTVAHLYTRQPQRVAEVVRQIKGIEVTAYPDKAGRLVVLGPDSKALIEKAKHSFRYEPVTGDPLQLIAIIEKLRKQGQVDSEGFIDDTALYEATIDHVYPDPVYRLWRCFNGLFQYPPDVTASLADGFHFGSGFQSAVVDLQAAHGNLRPLGSGAFAATAAGRLPNNARMIDLATHLSELGVDIPTGKQQSLEQIGDRQVDPK